jgi:hypothetical protein
VVRDLATAVPLKRLLALMAEEEEEEWVPRQTSTSPTLKLQWSISEASVWWKWRAASSPMAKSSRPGASQITWMHHPRPMGRHTPQEDVERRRTERWLKMATTTRTTMWMAWLWAWRREKRQTKR